MVRTVGVMDLAPGDPTPEEDKDIERAESELDRALELFRFLLTQLRQTWAFLVSANLVAIAYGLTQRSIVGLALGALIGTNITILTRATYKDLTAIAYSAFSAETRAGYGSYGIVRTFWKAMMPGLTRQYEEIIGLPENERHNELRSLAYRTTLGARITSAVALTTTLQIGAAVYCGAVLHYKAF